MDAFSVFEQIKNEDFHFDEPSHVYTYQGEKIISVSQFLERFSPTFESHDRSLSTSGKLDVRQDQILKIWKNKNDFANEIGSATHQWIQDYLAGLNPPIPANTYVQKRVQKFMEFYQTKMSKMKPVAQEIQIFSPTFRIGGTFDALFEFKNKYFVFDWKTNFKFTTNQDYAHQNFLYPFQHLGINKFNGYSMQISLYRLILHEWGLKTRTGYIVWIGPEGEIEIYEALDLRVELLNYLREINK